MTITGLVETIQFCYPQIYYACHTRHGRKRSSETNLSARDSQMLVHLDRERPMSVSLLSRHLGLAVSTVSEALTKLERFGYVQKTAAPNGDRRHVGIVLTGRGVAAVQAGSVLETARLLAVARRLPRADRAAIARAMSHLARACRPSLDEKRRWSDA